MDGRCLDVQFTHGVAHGGGHMDSINSVSPQPSRQPLGAYIPGPGSFGGAGSFGGKRTVGSPMTGARQDWRAWSGMRHKAKKAVGRLSRKHASPGATPAPPQHGCSRIHMMLRNKVSVICYKGSMDGDGMRDEFCTSPGECSK